MKRRAGRLSFEDAFDECVELMRAGRSVDAYLKAYPEYAAELTLLLDVVADVRVQRQVPPRAPEVAAASRQRFMAAAQQMGAAAAVRRAPTLAEGLAIWWSDLLRSLAGPGRPAYAMAALLLVVVILGLSATQAVTASAYAMPGDSLYPVKLISEQVQLLLARDPGARLALEQQFTERRLQEARYAIEHGVAVGNLRISGVLEAFSETEWVVAGLPLRITADTTIVGEPAVGAHVSGMARAPGDGSLIALSLNVLPGSRGAARPAADTPTPTFTPTAAPPADTATPTGTPASTPTAAWAPTQRPTVAPAATSVPTPTPTRTALPSPTATMTRAPKPTPTVGPSPTLEKITTGYAEGTVASFDNNVWRIQNAEQDVWVRVDANTQYVNSPRIGDWVRADFLELADKSLLATMITAIGKADATPEPMEFGGLIWQMDGDVWVINQIPVHVGPNTTIEGDPALYAYAEVDAERRANGWIWARRIKVYGLDEREFTDLITLVGSNYLLVGDRRVMVDANTVFVGDPPMVGRLADVRVWLMPDGRLLAQMIYVWPITPTPTITPTRPTRTPAPSATPTATDTPAPPPTQTPTPAPTATYTPEPTATWTSAPPPTVPPTSVPTVPPTATVDIPAPTATPASTQRNS